MILFPSSLPAPEQSLALTSKPAVTRSVMESGRTRQRNRYYKVAHSYQVSWLLTDFEYNILKLFIEFEIYNGAAWFYLKLSEDSTELLSKARIVDGIVNASYIPHNNWRISVTLDVEPSGARGALWYYLNYVSANSFRESFINKLSSAANSVASTIGVIHYDR